MNATIVKVFLYAYPHLSALAEASEVAAENKAALSFLSPKCSLDACTDVAEELFVSDRLLSLKEQLDLVLDALSDEEKFLLEYKYFRRRKILASISDMVPTYSLRTYFRKQNAALSSVRAKLMFLGWTDEKFFAEFSDFSPFMKMYRALLDGQELTLIPKRAHGLQNSKCSVSVAATFRLPFKANTATPTAATQATQIAAISPAESPSFSSDGVSTSTDVEGMLKKSSLRS